jgi:hypothetical protein
LKVARRELEGQHRPGLGPFSRRAREVEDRAVRGLIAMLGAIGQKLLHDRAHRLGDPSLRRALVRKGRGLDDMRVNQLERVGRFEGQHAGEQLVERGAERVQVRARVDGAVHPARLLRGDVGQRPREGLHRRRRLDRLSPSGRNPEVDQADVPEFSVDEDILGLDIAVDDPPPVHLGERSGQKGSQVERGPDRQRALGQRAAERCISPLLEHQRKSLAIRLEADRPDDPRHLQGAEQRVLVPQPLQCPRGRCLVARELEHDLEAALFVHSPHDARLCACVQHLAEDVVHIPNIADGVEGVCKPVPDGDRRYDRV